LERASKWQALCWEEKEDEEEEEEGLIKF